MSELDKLRRLYRLQQAGIDDVTGAEIISSGKSPLSDELIINRDSLDGLKAGDTATDQNRLVGQLTQALPYSSEVMLLYNGQSIVPVMVTRTGERNLLYGGGNKLDSRYPPSASDLKAKNILLTSGLDNVYPAGIPAATVDTVERSSGSPYYIAPLSPFAALRGSRFMLVVSQPESQTTKPQQ